MEEKVKKVDFKEAFSKIKAEFNVLKTEHDPQQRRVLKAQLEKVLNPIKEAARTKELISILQWERSLKVLSVGDEFKLNQIEYDEITPGEDQGEALCSNRIPGPGIQCQVGDKIKWKKYFDRERDMDMYLFYAPKIITPEEQIQPALARKLAQGFHPEPSDYLPEKTIINTYTLSEKQFVKYFVI